MSVQNSSSTALGAVEGVGISVGTLTVGSTRETRIRELRAEAKAWNALAIVVEKFSRARGNEWVFLCWSTRSRSGAVRRTDSTSSDL